MKKQLILFLLIAFVSSSYLFAQKKTEKTVPQKKRLTFEDAQDFKYIKTLKMSSWGNWVAYEVAPDWGDGFSTIMSTLDTHKHTSITRGTKFDFPLNSEKWFAALVQPKVVDIENAKSPKDKPKSSLVILNLEDFSSKNFEKVKKFQFSNDGKWLVFEKDEEIEKDKDLKFKPIGNNIGLVHLKSGTEIDINNVYEYQFDSLANFFFYAVSAPDGKGDGLFRRNLNEEFAPEYIIEKNDKTLYSNLTYSLLLKQLAYLVAEVSSNGYPNDCSLKLWDAGNPNVTQFLIKGNDIPSDLYLYYKNQMKFTRDGKRLWIGIKPVAERFPPEKYEIKFNDTTIVNIDSLQSKSSLLLWNYKDPQIMTQQQNQWERKKDQVYKAIYDFGTQKLIPLADETFKDVEFTNNPLFTIGYDESPYLVQSTWQDLHFDLYKIYLNNGSRKLIAQDLQEPASLSPNGHYVAFYKDSNWYAYDNIQDTTRHLNQKMPVIPFHNEDWDLPDKAPSYGFAGWYDEGNRILLYDKYDIWMVFTGDPEGFAALTMIYGRDPKLNMSFRAVEFDKDKEYYTDKDTLILNGFRFREKYNSLYFQDFRVLGPETVLREPPKNINIRAKAKYNNSAILTKEKFDEFPDLYFTLDFFKKSDSLVKLTDLNSQLENYYWGTSTIVSWQNSKGDTLMGFIMKPENYNPSKRYPVIIHFYDRFSDMANLFQRPQINHRPNPLIYLNDDYIMFYPDIKYTIGEPGYSAVDALVTGARKLIDMGIADSNAIGIQGHSWSGYQTAFIITQTDLFKAACAGAPVGNMTSAYSGIRLESGLARQFQYEKQQSRIGGNLWDSLNNYIKNSPIFAATKTNTPLLIEFGNEDEAVPWQQGIELYLAYRRLQKPVFMLEYQQEPHIVRKYYNKIDYARKMKEFFDHYLKGKPAPDWLIKGLPYRGN
ncbi:prolyl oligopeptidase family serine peptidase [bacterium]|nr:prolyl oligopeptidase family serine peptidase [bacterium]